MATDNFLNQFGRSARVSAEPLESDVPSLAVPTNVPYVTPRNVIPSNLSDIARFSKFNQIAQALGGSGISSGDLTSGWQEALQKRKSMDDNLAFHQGLVQAMGRTAQARDIFADITNNGWGPVQKNPFFQMGYQAQLSSELSTQYQRDLVMARLQNPQADPLELQNQIKQKYSPLLQGARPDVVAKFFIENAMQSDHDDEQRWEKYQSDHIDDDLKRSSGAQVSNVLDSSWAQVQSGALSPEQMKQNLKQAFEGPLQLSYGVGKNYNVQTQAMIDEIQNKAATLVNQDGSDAAMKDKLSVLDTLRDVKLPTGQPLLADPNYAEAYKKARESLIRSSLELENISLQSAKMKREDATDQVIQQMALDAGSHNLQPVEHYLTLSKGPVDPKDIASTYGTFDSHVVTPKELGSNQNQVEMRLDASTMSPNDFKKKWAPVAKSDPTLAGDFSSGLTTSASLTKQRTDEAKLGPVPVGEMNTYLKTIHAPITRKFSAGRWTGYGAQQVQQAVDNDLQLKYRTLFKQRYLELAKQSPESAKDPMMQQTWMDQVWSELKPKLQQDYASITNQSLPYGKIIAGFQTQTSAPRAPQAKPSAAPATQYSWVNNQQAFLQADQQFRNRSGPIYDSLVNSLKKSGKLNQLDYQFRQAFLYNHQHPGMYILDKLKSQGIQTWDAQTQNQPKRSHVNVPQ